MKMISAPAFELCDSPPPLVPGKLHLWFLTATKVDDSRKAVAKAASHALTLLLARYGGTESPPVLSRGPHGKPWLQDSKGIEFNLSHSGGSALLAFARGQSLGIDLEHLDRRQHYDDIAERYFTPEEARSLRRLPPERHVDAFLRLLTCKEAVVKALGSGLGFGLDRLSFTLDANGHPEALASIAAEGGAATDWQILALTPAAGLVGALAWCGSPLDVRAMRWPA